MNEFDEIKIYCKENDVVSVSQLLKYARKHNEKWISWISRKPDNFWEIRGESRVNRTEPIEIIRGVRKINGS